MKSVFLKLQHNIAKIKRYKYPFLATFGVLLNSVDTDGSLTNFMSLPESNQILILAQLMYGYGYVGPFALEYENAVPTCGIFEYEQVCVWIILGITTKRY